MCIKINYTNYYSMSCQGHMATLLACCYDAEFSPEESPEDVFKR